MFPGATAALDGKPLEPWLLFDGGRTHRVYSDFSLKKNKKWKWKLLSPVWLFETPWTVESMEFSKPEYWRG